MAQIALEPRGETALRDFARVNAGPLPTLASARRKKKSRARLCGVSAGAGSSVSPCCAAGIPACRVPADEDRRRRRLEIFPRSLRSFHNHPSAKRRGPSSYMIAFTVAQLPADAENLVVHHGALCVP